MFANTILQISLPRLFVSLTSFALCFALVSKFGMLFYPILASTLLFWLAELSFIYSDLIDSNLVDDKSEAAWSINVFGLGLCWLSVAAFAMQIYFLLLQCIGYSL